ncbi:glycosyltransferase family 2 protein [Pelotalea chapellei]|uniref:glycosyltransferase family 2 protein n=1 Tax=Pelotalea chapellei TaxID=44671 RepID=UPI001FE79F19|nr:glycosyltransferase family 2 protein [Pelotalea chapellei]
MIPRHIAAYLAKHVSYDHCHLNEPPVASYRGAVVIPSLAEFHNLPHTLQSIATNPPELLEQFLILIVVNQRADASPAEQADNLATLTALPAWKREYGLKHLRWVDAASPGHELPHKQGVGLARKIGLDLALNHLEFNSYDPLLICLDADTIVQPDYLSALAHHFESATAGGASLPYRHRAAATPESQAAIDRYELFLRVYVLGLEQAGSPWAFHTVGSAMASRASAYVASGGMNKRLAGEDFYFLQQVHKTAGVAPLSGTTVHPSPRSSHRVPFGTGRAVGDMLNKGEQQLLFYQPELFGILGEWLHLITNNSSGDGDEIEQAAGSISPHLRSYLEQTGFGAAWDNLRRHNPDRQRLITAFHGWFDAFRTMRLMHHLTDSAWPRISPEQAVRPLLDQAGLTSGETVSNQLELLRSMQGV